MRQPLFFDFVPPAAANAAGEATVFYFSEKFRLTPQARLAGEACRVCILQDISKLAGAD
ncbi:hypothetical protein [Hymenobacter terrigena]